MSEKIIKSCSNCKHCNTEEDLCDAGMWDRNDGDENWLHSDHDFEIYITTPRICTEREEKQ